tara:strand:+ start:191 stop:415 length:225 start_codon:yes stop_codon:yes gene_type:complete
MNSFERRLHKRAEESRLKWKSKALTRQSELRKLKDRLRDLEKSRAYWKEKYTFLSQALSEESRASVSGAFSHFF